MGKRKRQDRTTAGGERKREKKERALKESGKARGGQHGTCMYGVCMYMYVCMCLLVWSDKHQRW